MKLILAQPAWSDIHGEFTGVARGVGNFPPLGIGYLASLARRAGHEVTIVDAEAAMLDDEAAARDILARRPDVVGLSAVTPIYHKAVRVAAGIKAAAPDLPVIIGGPHVSLLGGEVFEPCFDLAVRGEAELVFADLLAELGKPKPEFDRLPGVMYRRNGAVVDGGWAPAVQNLDDLPFPAWDLYDLPAYRTHLKARGAVRFIAMHLTRGCPFRCAFCSASTLEGRRVRSRSPENVVAEMRLLKEEYGVDHFCFNDSTLTLDRQLIERLCDLLDEAQLGITWEGWTRANRIDKALLERMVGSGFVRVSFGVESGSPRILKLINKEVAHEDMRRAYRWAGELNLESTCSAMMGHPGETEKEVWQTVRFIRSLPEVEYAPLSIAVPYPGTELWRMARAGEHGLKLLSEDYSQYLRYAGGVMEVNGMRPEYLRKLQKRALIWMHLTPRKLVGIIRRFGFWSLAKAVLGL